MCADDAVTLIVTETMVSSPNPPRSRRRKGLGRHGSGTAALQLGLAACQNTLLEGDQNLNIWF